jgi:pSer/pThr/pTyr-binding forkhead associated (FHA) protein
MEDFPKLVNSHDDSVITINNSSVVLPIFDRVSGPKVSFPTGFIGIFLQSTNGTLINSTLCKFNESVDLKHGDVIKLGTNNLNFVFISSKQTSPKDSTVENPVNITSQIPPDDESSLETPSIVEGFEEPFELDHVKPETPTEENKIPPKNDEQNLEIMETELTCSICSELFIKAVTLSCSHTYCKFCIEEWRKNKSSCPICRKFIATVSPTLVLDNFIDKIISTQSDQVKETRQNIIKQREEMVVNVASSSTVSTSAVVEGGQIIEIFSEVDDDDDEDESDYNYLSDDHDYDSYECYYGNRWSSGRGSRYYGGYGRCYICDQEGHWANSCPLKGQN